MSWSVFMGIVNYDEKTKQYEVTSALREMYCLKTLCESRCVLDDNIEAVSLPKEVYNLVGEYKYYEVYKVLKRDLLDFDCLVKLDRYGDNAYKIAMGCESYKSFLESIEEDDYKVRMESNPDDYVAIYDEHTEVHKGQFFKASSFHTYADKLQDEYDKLVLKKGRMQRIQNSLKYMALNDERKENVMSEYNFLDDEIDDVLGKISACLYVIGVLEYYDEWDKPAYAFIYSE